MSKIAIISLSIAALTLVGCAGNSSSSYAPAPSQSRVASTQRVNCPPGGTFQVCSTLTVLPAESSTASAMRLRY